MVYRCECKHVNVVGKEKGGGAAGLPAETGWLTTNKTPEE